MKKLTVHNTGNARIQFLNDVSGEAETLNPGDYKKVGPKASDLLRGYNCTILEDHIEELEEKAGIEKTGEEQVAEKNSSTEATATQSTGKKPGRPPKKPS